MGAAPLEAEPARASAPARESAFPDPSAEAASLKREALTVAAEVARAFPQEALSHALLGSACLNTGQSTEAVKHLKKCLELNPEQAEAHEILARIAFEKGDLEEAIRRSEEALRQGATNPEVYHRQARAFLDLGRTDEAIRTLQTAARLPRPMAETFYLSGQAYLQSGDFARAQESFRKATEMVPDHTQAFFGLFTACQRLGQTNDAARYRGQFQRLEAIDRQTLTDRNAQEDSLTGLSLVRSTVARTLFGAAQIYRAHDQPARSAALLGRAALLDAESPIYRAALEAHFAQRNAPAEGMAAFEALVAEQPGNPLNYYYLARLHGRWRQVDAAERAYRRVIELAPGWPDGYRSLADLLIRTDRPTTEPLELVRKAIELEPSAANYYVLSLVCQKNRDRPGAIEAMKRAVAASPNDARYLEVLRKLEAQAASGP